MLLSGIICRRCTVSRVRASSLKCVIVNSGKTGSARSSGLCGSGGVRLASTLPDVCGLPVVTSSWKAIKSLDEAYTEVSGSLEAEKFFVWCSFYTRCTYMSESWWVKLEALYRRH